MDKKVMKYVKQLEKNSLQLPLKEKQDEWFDGYDEGYKVAVEDLKIMVVEDEVKILKMKGGRKNGRSR